MYGAPGEMGGVVIEPEEVRDIDNDLGRGAGGSVVVIIIA